MVLGVTWSSLGLGRYLDLTWTGELGRLAAPGSQLTRHRRHGVAIVCRSAAPTVGETSDAAAETSNAAAETSDGPEFAAAPAEIAAAIAEIAAAISSFAAANPAIAPPNPEIAAANPESLRRRGIAASTHRIPPSSKLSNSRHGAGERKHGGSRGVRAATAITRICGEAPVARSLRAIQKLPSVERTELKRNQR